MKKTILSLVCLLLVGVVLLGLVLVKNISGIKAFSNQLRSLTKQPQSDQVIFDLRTLLELNVVVSKLSENKLLSVFLKKDQKELLARLQTISSDVGSVLSELSDQEQRWLFIFQNSNELRATGGFMGSYAIVEINEGKIISINTEDIYDADGQFNGYFEAPSGVKEYLSSGKGLRLPDANWHIDTAKSAEQILPFFAWGNKQNVKGIVFVNLEFAKKLLEFLGPIELTDYNTIVTQDNLDEVLRSRRDDFFPGSTQKKHMLSQLLTQVRLKTTSLNPEQLILLLDFIQKEITQNNLQFYSNNQTIDAVFEKNKMRQIVNIPDNSEFLYLVESNVGINKANKAVSRQVSITKTPNQRTVTIDFTNNNKRPTISKLTQITELETTSPATQEAKINNHLAYVNYQRVVVPKNWELTSVLFQNTTVEPIDQELLIIDGVEFKQIGFLVVIPEEKNATAQILFNVPESLDQIYIQKQPGLPATNYVLEYNQNQETHTITNNLLLKYP